MLKLKRNYIAPRQETGSLTGHPPRHKSTNVRSKIKPFRINWTKESIDEHRMIKLSTDPEYLYPTERKILWEIT